MPAHSLRFLLPALGFALAAVAPVQAELLYSASFDSETSRSGWNAGIGLPDQPATGLFATGQIYFQFRPAGNGVSLAVGETLRLAFDIGFTNPAKGGTAPATNPTKIGLFDSKGINPATQPTPSTSFAGFTGYLASPRSPSKTTATLTSATKPGTTPKTAFSSQTTAPQTSKMSP